MNNFLWGGRGMPFGQSNNSLSKCPTEEKERSLGFTHSGARIKLLVYTLPMIIYCVLFSNVFAQSAGERTAVKAQQQIQPVLVGDQLPEDFWSKEFLFYHDGDTVRKNLSEYRGKLLVLDFWATWCAICLGQLKEKQALFIDLEDKAGFLLVNSIKTKDNFTIISEKQKKLASRSFDGVFNSIIEDEYLMKLFPGNVYPRYVWIGPRGNLIALTSALSVTEPHISDVLSYFKNYKP